MYWATRYALSHSPQNSFNFETSFSSSKFVITELNWLTYFNELFPNIPIFDALHIAVPTTILEMMIT